MNEIILVTAVVVAGLFVWLIYMLGTRVRTREVRRWARKHGWGFHNGRDTRVSDRFPDFGRLREGDRCRASNIVEGHLEGHDFFAFDYRVARYGGGRGSVHEFNVVIVRANIPLKPLRVQPQSIADTIIDALNPFVVEFESAEFNRRYRVTVEDRRWAFDVLHPRAIQRLMDDAPHTIQFDDRHAMISNDELLEAGREYEDLIRCIIGLLTGMPRYLVERQCETAAASGESA